MKTLQRPCLVDRIIREKKKTKTKKKTERQRERERDSENEVLRRKEIVFNCSFPFGMVQPAKRFKVLNVCQANVQLLYVYSSI